MIFVLGAGGLAREVEWLLHNAAENGKTNFRPTHFVAHDGAPNVGSTLRGRPVIAESEFMSSYGCTAAACFMAVGAPALKKRIVGSLRSFAELYFPAVLDPSVLFDSRQDWGLTLGKGALVCAGSVLEPEVRLDDFVLVNMGCTIGHQTHIGSYSSICPGANIAGGVRTGERVFIGSGAVVLEGTNICSGTVIGAGAVVASDIDIPGTYVGIPARRQDKKS